MKLLATMLVGAGLVVGPAYGTATPTVRAEVEPAAVGVGDSLTYVVEARLDRHGLDAGSAHIVADTGPFVQVGPASTTRSTDGPFVVVRLEQRLACLDLACAPVDRRRAIRLPAARVIAARAGGALTATRATPVAIVVDPRLSAAAVRSGSPPYRQQTALPAPTHNAGQMYSLLLVVSAALAFVAVSLAVLALWPQAAGHAREAELPRALRLLRESATRPPSDRRRAAGLVSRVVGAAGAKSLADDAGHIAWSATSPEPARTDALAERAERGAR
jgi:hypothetical protein